MMFSHWLHSFERPCDPGSLSWVHSFFNLPSVWNNLFYVKLGDPPSLQVSNRSGFDRSLETLSSSGGRLTSHTQTPLPSGSCPPCHVSSSLTPPPPPVWTHWRSPPPSFSVPRPSTTRSLLTRYTERPVSTSFVRRVVSSNDSNRSVVPRSPRVTDTQ